ncbi:MAG: hypothetical protein MI920_08955 [Kiloniellales bacterium]|nr:hypothetical protein [Kiloniellales bacterium]
MAIGFCVALSACSFGEESLWPSLTGEDPAGETTVPVAAAPGPGPVLGETVFEAPGVTPGTPTGTLVGQKVDELRGELARLQDQLSNQNNELQTLRVDARDSASAYHSVIGRVNARLQVGTTPGNPELVAQWNQAQGELGKVGESISQLNALSAQSASTSALAAFMLDSTRATFGLYGALEDDHRQLAVLEDEVNKTVVVLDRLLNELTEDIARTQNYFSAERSNLTAMQIAIDSGEYIGGSLAGRAFGIPPPPPAGGAASLVGQRQPLVVIRFSDPNVDYEQALFTAVNRALERKPNAGFDLVAVAPSGGNPAQVSIASTRSRRNAEGVLRSLTGMGLPPDRVTLSATTSANAQVNEVHVYVR